MRKRKTQTELQDQCDLFNFRNPVGTLIDYHHVIGEKSHSTHKTRSKAEVLSGHTAVVWLEGVHGCVALDACEPAKIVVGEERA